MVVLIKLIDHPRFQNVSLGSIVKLVSSHEMQQLWRISVLSTEQSFWSGVLWLLSCVGVERLEGDESWQRRSDIFTFNKMVDACAKRWNFLELDLILLLLAKEGVAFEAKTHQAVLKKFAVREISQVQSLKAPSSLDLWSAGCAHQSENSQHVPTFMFRRSAIGYLSL